MKKVDKFAIVLCLVSMLLCSAVVALAAWGVFTILQEVCKWNL